MEQRTLKISGVLSDPTRFSIYQYVVKQRGEVTVQEVAENFNIHANVARLHLTKLEDVNMVISETKKTGKGGRPSRRYRLSDEVVSLQFPARDYQRLAEMCLESLVQLGEEGKEALISIGYRFGKETAQDFMTKLGKQVADSSTEEKLSHIEHISTNLGLHPEINFDKETNIANFHINNCTYKELIDEHANALCAMHYSLISGIFKFFFGNVTIKEEQLMNHPGCNACSYKTVLL